jgi:hypothetical protein
MRVRLLVFALAACGLAAQTNDAHARKLADIHKLMELTGGEKVANEMFDAMSANWRKMSGSEAAGAEEYLRAFRKELDLKKMIEIVVDAYDKNLSAEDIQGLIRFYQTPTGQHMLAAMPKINQEMIEQISVMGQEAAKKVLKRMQEEKGK